MRIIRNRHFWFILVLFALCSVLHYTELIGITGTTAPSSHFGLTRHALDRVLFLVPIIYSAYIFRLAGGLGVSLAALLVMLPRATLLSPAPVDAILETVGVILVGALASFWSWTLAKAKGETEVALAQLRSAHEILQHYVQSARSNEKRQTMLNAISSMLAESLELENILNKAVHMVSELMEVEVTLIFSLDAESQELKLAAYEGVSDEFAGAVDGMKIGEGFYEEVAKTGQPMVVENVSRDPILTKPEVNKMRIQIQLIVPLVLRDITTGILCVAMRRPRQFTPEDIELLTAVGTQIATAIENARLYEKEHLTAQRLAVSERNYRQLFENANDAIWVHDLEGNIIAANEATEKLVGYSVKELAQMNVKDFLPDESLNLAGQVRRKLLEREAVEQPYEQSLTRKDGTKAVLRVTTSLVTESGKTTGFQHMARDVSEEKRMQDNMRYYLHEITKAQEEERKRIARELHDDTAQALYALTRQVDNFARTNTNLPAGNAAFLGDLGKQINKVLQDLRRFSQDLRPPMLDDLGLLATLRWLVSESRERCGIEVELRVVGAEQRLPPEVEFTLFRIVQESVRNIEKHSQALKAKISVEFSEGEIRVSVSDNGKGFNLSEDLVDLVRTGKLGLAGMEERARLLNGSLRIESAPGKGTTVTVEIPI